jgi:transmembrane sensor
MSQLKDPVEALARAVREAEDEPSDRAAIARVRRRLLDSRPARSHVRPRLVGVAFAVAAILLALVVLRPSTSDQPAPLAFSVGDPPVAGELGESLSRAGEEPVPVKFSEGSRVDLERGSRARVTEARPSGASILLERGKLQARITKGDAPRDWKFHAGPFRIDVTGTEFAAAWNPDTEELSVLLHEGSVRVHGPLVAGRDVRAGERLTVSLREQRAELAVGPERVESIAVRDVDDEERAPAETTEVPADPSEPERAAGARAAGEPSARGAGGPRPAAGPSWRELQAQGRYADAMKALDDAGFAALVVSSSASELRRLVEAARLGGRSDRAYAALVAQRERFGARGESAFLLGRISMDQRRSPGEANRWFSTYLQESPNGPFAEQALGRLLELGAKGSPESAKQLAERYLARFPNGAHARLARSLLEP